LEAFSYSVSHDLRAPLRHVDGFVGIVQEELNPVMTENGRRLLAGISRAARQMGSLIDDLLAFSRVGRTELSRKLIRMDEPLNEALQEVKRDTNGRNIRWEIEPLPQVFAD